MDISILKKELRDMDYGWDNQFHYPVKMSPKAIDELINELVDDGWNDSIIDHMTDKVIWEVEILVEGEKFMLCGDIYEGGFVIMKEEF